MAHSKLWFPAVQAALDCDFCEGHVKVEWYCLTCPANLCEKCMVLHTSRKNFRKHKVISRLLFKETQEQIESETVSKCISHSQNDVSMMCVTCEIPVCNDCILSTHNGHVFEDLRAKVDRSVENLSKYIQKQKEREKRIVGQIENNNEELHFIDCKEEEAKNGIIKNRDVVIGCVKAEFDSLIEQLETRKKKNKSDITAYNSDLHSAHVKIQNIIKNAQTKMDSQSYTEIEEFLKAEETDIKDFGADITLSVPKFHVQVHHSLPKIGTLHFEERPVKKITVHLPSPSDAKVIRTFITSHRATEIRAISPSQIWCCYNGGRSLQLYDINGKMIKSVSLTFSVQGFVINKVGYFIACDLDGKSIKQVNQEGCVSTLCSTSPRQPLGICLNHKQQPVVCMGDSLVVYSSDCNTKLQEFTHDQQGKLLFVWSFRVAMNSTSEYCVADLHGKKVVAIGVKGRLKWTYTGGPWQNTFKPWNVCDDNHQSLIVADAENDKIHVLDKEGHFIMCITNVRTHRPRGLAVSNEGTLWIGESNESKKVHVVKYLNDK